jgi:hypothetical protein
MPLLLSLTGAALAILLRRREAANAGRKRAIAERIAWIATAHPKAGSGRAVDAND